MLNITWTPCAQDIKGAQAALEEPTEPDLLEELELMITSGPADRYPYSTIHSTQWSLSKLQLLRPFPISPKSDLARPLRILGQRDQPWRY
jgi:hypothetical protein